VTGVSSTDKNVSANDFRLHPEAPRRGAHTYANRPEQVVVPVRRPGQAGRLTQHKKKSLDPSISCSLVRLCERWVPRLETFKKPDVETNRKEEDKATKIIVNLRNDTELQPAPLLWQGSG
jgi:hypothetical protein